MWDYMINILNKITAKNDYLLRCEKLEDIEKGVNTGKGQIIESKFRSMKDYILIFPIVYFLTSITILFILVLMNLFKEKFRTKQELYPFQHFPVFFKLSSVHSHLYDIALMLISMSGIINVWFFCSMLLQRFSVPELRSKKISVHLMFILGIFANIIFIFFGFSSDILRIESIKFRNLKVSLSLIMFLIFILFNIIFSIMSTRCIDCLDNKMNTRVVKNKKVKKCVIYLAVFVMFVYIVAIIIDINGSAKILKGIQKIIVNIILLISPYALYILNAFTNLLLYTDLVFIREIMSQIMERDYFIFLEESEELIT